MKNLVLMLFTVLIALFSGVKGNAQLIHDESYKDKEFLKFKTELQYYVLKRDKEGLKSLLADTVEESKEGCGSEATKEEFMECMFNKGGEHFWVQLEDIIRFGFCRTENAYVPVESENGTYFQAPSFLSNFNQEEEKVIILGENVNIRTLPSKTAPIVRQASYEIFSTKGKSETDDYCYAQGDGITWVRLDLGNGDEGYVANFLTSKENTRILTVTFIKGKWKICSFYQSAGC